MSEADIARQAAPQEAGSLRCGLGLLGNRFGRFGWLLVDQAVFALTNMSLNVLFARWLTADEYGLYSLSFSGFIFLSVLHWATIIEPLLVQAATIPAERRRSFVLKSILVQIVILGAAALLSAVVWMVGTRAGRSDVAAGGAAALLGGPMVLLLLTARRLCLVFLSARLSAQIGTLYLICALATAWGLHAAGLISWWVLWVVMAGWSLAGAAIICVILLRHMPSGEPQPIRELLRFQARYARAGSLGACSSWLRSDGFYVILAHYVGLSAVGQTRAMVILANPIVQANSALNATWLVQFSRARNDPALPSRILRQAALYGGAALVGVGALAIAHQTIVAIVYGGRYEDVAWQLPLFCLACCINGLEALLTSAIKSSGAAWAGYFPQIFGSFTALGFGLVLASWLGQGGAPLTTLSAAVAGVAIAGWLFLRKVRRAGHGFSQVA